jgi:hypothetical protein
MRYSFCFILAVAVALSAGDLMLDEPVRADPLSDFLQYDDGTGWWVTWEGMYRGVWFNLHDFPGSPIPQALRTEYWFYHDSDYPWDTSSFYAELYNGGVAGPETELDETSATATHNSSVYINCYCGIEFECWVFVNTEMSYGNWPSTIGDNTPQAYTDHSLYSDDMIVWEPWIVQGLHANDYLMRLEVSFCPLEQNTWGSIKTLF